jgi:uncharacterized protein YkwD
VGSRPLSAGVAIALGLTLACGLSLGGATGAAAEPPAERAPACQGVHLLSGPLIASGLSDPLLGTIVLEIVNPLEGVVGCQPVGVPRSARRGAGDGCANAGVSAVKLKRREAAKATRCLIDEVRRAHGLNALEARGELGGAAKDHNRHMLSTSCFAHQCGGERDLVERVTSAGYLPCSCAWTVGENLAWGVRYRSTPAAILDAWMHSPGHRDMILRSGLQHVGVNVIKGRPGAPNASGATFTADFGVKR